MGRMTTSRRVALTGLLTALSIVLSLLEAALPPLPGLPLGVKPGLSNIGVIAMAHVLPLPAIVFVSVVRAGVALVTRGVTAGFMSLCGGLLSATLMWVLLRPSRSFSYLFVSIAGAVTHNVAQLCVASLLFGSASVFYYLPVVLVGAVAFGAANGIAARILVAAMYKAGLLPRGG